MKLDEVQNKAFEKWKDDVKEFVNPRGLAFRISEDGKDVIFFRRKDEKDVFSKSIKQLVFNLTGRPITD